MRLVSLFTAMMAVFGISIATMNDTEAADLENTIYLELKDGRVVIELPELAPNHVKRIKQLSRAGFYDGIVFHRVIEGLWHRPVIRQAPVVAGRTSRILRPSSAVSGICAVLYRWRVPAIRTAPTVNSLSSSMMRLADNQYTVGTRHPGMEFVDQIKGSPAFGSSR